MVCLWTSCLPQAPCSSSRLGWECSSVVELPAEHVKGPSSALLGKVGDENDPVRFCVSPTYIVVWQQAFCSVFLNFRVQLVEGARFWS